MTPSWNESMTWSEVLGKAKALYGNIKYTTQRHLGFSVGQLKPWCIKRSKNINDVIHHQMTYHGILQLICYINTWYNINCLKESSVPELYIHIEIIRDNNLLLLINFFWCFDSKLKIETKTTVLGVTRNCFWKTTYFHFAWYHRVKTGISVSSALQNVWD